MTVLKAKTACRFCPWRRDSVQGWLGDSTPQEFLTQCLSEQHMPCHIAVDYDDPDWERELDSTAHCVGSLVFFKNSCKMPRDRTLAEMIRELGADPEVFSFGPEFLEHHGEK